MLIDLVSIYIAFFDIIILSMLVCMFTYRGMALNYGWTIGTKYDDLNSWINYAVLPLFIGNCIGQFFYWKWYIAFCIIIFSWFLANFLVLKLRNRIQIIAPISAIVSLLFLLLEFIINRL